MSKKESLAGFGETLHATLRSYKMWHKYAPKMLPSLVAYCAVSGISPYVTIYFSSQILNELSGARDPKRLLFLAALTVLLTAVLGFVTALLYRWQLACAKEMYYTQQKMETDKLLSMDFSAADDSHTHKLLTHMYEFYNWQGRGISFPLNYGENLIKPLFGILSAIALTVTLFTQRVPESAGSWTVLNNPLVLFLSLAALIGFTLLSPLCQNKCNELFSRASKEAINGNRIFMFCFWEMPQPERSVDARMYRQDKLIDHYSQQDKSFLPGGAFARNSKGAGGFWTGAASAISGVFTGLAYGFVCLKAWAGAFAVGSVAQYVAAITALSGNINQLATTWGEFRANAVFLRETFEFLDTPNKMYQGSLTTEKRSDREYDIEFRDVSFRYPGTETWALRHVNMKFRVGSRLAVVGENGSGKTTFIKLLCRLYDPTEGEILLNGIDIKKYDYRDYIALFSVVFQDFQLLSFPLGQNVAAAVKFDASHAESCLEMAGFGHRLNELPLGLETPLYKEFDESGIQVSGGETQKIALARALYKDAPFVVLDEPTAALDPVAEMEVYQNFDRIVGDKTAVYISHRLSSCKFCDEIVVFDHGQILQQGSHNNLVESPGKYRELWEAQAQYYTKPAQ
ncbi:MAG: ABC transporter ATP-binding protein [Acutalibacter sp.]|jgi:ATP-binding cassette subfamily B protein